MKGSGDEIDFLPAIKTVPLLAWAAWILAGLLGTDADGVNPGGKRTAMRCRPEGRCGDKDEVATPKFVDDVESGPGGGDGKEMGVGAVGPRNGGDVDDVFEIGMVRPRVDRRRLGDRGFGEATDAS